MTKITLRSLPSFFHKIILPLETQSLKSHISTNFLPRWMECRRGLAMGILSVRLSVRLSVCLSVKRVDCDKTEESCMYIFISYERTFILVFWEGEWLVGSDPSTWNFGSTGPRWSEIADFESIIARSASAVQPSEKSSINTNRKSPTRFPMSPRWSNYVAPKSPKGGFKNAKRLFFLYYRTPLDESVLQRLFVWKLSAGGKVVGHSLA